MTVLPTRPQRPNPVSSLRRYRRTLVVASVGFLSALLIVFIYAALRFPPSRAESWFAGMAVIVGAVAVVAAVCAAVLALPGYVEWAQEQRRRPDARIHIEVGHPERDDLDVVPVESNAVTIDCDYRATVLVRVAVFNDGDGTLRNGVLNICVPTTANLSPADAASTGHRVIPGTSWNGDIEPGKTMRVRATVVETDFAPGSIRMYHVRADLPMNATTPLFVELGGDPPGVSRLISITTTSNKPARLIHQP